MHGRKLGMHRIKKSGLLPIFGFLSRQSFSGLVSRHGFLCRDSISGWARGNRTQASTRHDSAWASTTSMRAWPGCPRNNGTRMTEELYRDRNFCVTTELGLGWELLCRDRTVVTVNFLSRQGLVMCTRRT